MLKKSIYVLFVGVLMQTSILFANDSEALKTYLAQRGEETLRQAIGDDMPQWAKRIEWDLGFNEDYEPTGSILTVQPLYQDVEKKHTFFTQLSYYNYEQFEDRKNTTNIGFGYRHVTGEDYSILLGTNIFYDHEWDEGHDRIGFGIEAKMAMLDFTANYYNAVSGAKKISTDVEERALDGFDLELRSQVPYMPWANVGIAYYEWDSHDFKDIHGVKASLDMDIAPNWGLEVGFSDDNDDTQDVQVFANLKFSFGTDEKSRALSTNTSTLATRFIDDKPFVVRDMREHTLKKVRRQNKIITERNSSGVTISRAN